MLGRNVDVIQGAPGSMGISIFFIFFTFTVNGTIHTNECIKERKKERKTRSHAQQWPSKAGYFMTTQMD